MMTFCRYVVTEAEIRQGVMVDVSAGFTACSIRSLIGIGQSSSSNSSFVKKFLDLKPSGEPDEDAAGLLQRMRSCLVDRLKPDNVMRYTNGRVWINFP